MYFITEMTFAYYIVIQYLFALTLGLWFKCLYLVPFTLLRDSYDKVQVLEFNHVFLIHSNLIITSLHLMLVQNVSALGNQVSM